MHIDPVDYHYGADAVKRFELLMLKWKAKEIAFSINHPNFCKTCGGRGYYESRYDPSASGVSLSGGSMSDLEPCPDCQESNLCPLCGQKDTVKEVCTGQYESHRECSCGYNDDEDNHSEYLEESPEKWYW